MNEGEFDKYREIGKRNKMALTLMRNWCAHVCAHVEVVTEGGVGLIQAEHLRTPEEMAAYLEACLEEADGDAAFVAKALEDIARAKGMAQR